MSKFTYGHMQKIGDNPGIYGQIHSNTTISCRLFKRQWCENITTSWFHTLTIDNTASFIGETLFRMYNLCANRYSYFGSKS